jgi:hypothetical protein
VLFRSPINEKRKLFLPTGTFLIMKSPLASEHVTRFPELFELSEILFTTIVTAGRGADVTLSVILPRTVCLYCPKTIHVESTNKKNVIIIFLLIFSLEKIFLC